jgi:hypothetical protein
VREAEPLTYSAQDVEEKQHKGGRAPNVLPQDVEEKQFEGGQAPKFMLLDEDAHSTASPTKESAGFVFLASLHLWVLSERVPHATIHVGGMSPALSFSLCMIGCVNNLAPLKFFEAGSLSQQNAPCSTSRSA